MLALASVVKFASPLMLLIAEGGKNHPSPRRTSQSVIEINSLQNLVSCSRYGCWGILDAVTRLKRQYHLYNRLAFDSQLPPDVKVVWCSKIKDMGDSDPYIIRINTRLRAWPSAWKLTLLHEMVHIATPDETQEHGPKFYREMERIKRLGFVTKLL